MIFGLASVATLLVIVGILSFMLWPGDPNWHETGGVLNAFFGENTFAQMFTRFAFMLTITAVVGGMVAGRIKDVAEKAAITRVLSVVGIVGAVGGALAFQWYMTTIPLSAVEMINTRMPGHFGQLMVASVAVAVLWFIVTALKPEILRPWLAAVMTLVILVFGLAPEETAREIMRKPWVAGQYVYGNQVIGRDVPALGVKSELPVMEKQGVLATHPFIPSDLT